MPLVGIVSMDTAAFDVSAVPPHLLAAGEFIDLIDRRNPVEALAARAGTIGYEILTSLGLRYFRKYVGD